GASTYGRILSKETSVGLDDTYLFLNGPTQTLGMNLGSGSQDTLATANAIALNAWQHVTVTYNDATDRMPHLYLNGTEVAYAQQPAMTATLATSANPFILGNRTTQDRGFAGMIDEVQIYNYALSSAQVQSLYNSFSSVFSS